MDEVEDDANETDRRFEDMSHALRHAQDAAEHPQEPRMHPSQQSRRARMGPRTQRLGDPASCRPFVRLNDDQDFSTNAREGVERTLRATKRSQGSGGGGF